MSFKNYFDQFSPTGCDSVYIAGSHAYGTADKNSDIDIRGFIVRSAEDILLSKDFESKRMSAGDICFYSFDKFVAMLAEANPNIIEFFGIHRDAELGVVGKKIQENQAVFISKKIATTFFGFASSEQRRLDKMVHNQVGVTPEKISKCQYHFCRTCRMGAEALLTGEILTDRTNIDAEELKDIKHGCFLKQTGLQIEVDLEWYRLEHREIERLLKAEFLSKLPQTPNYEKINQFIMDTNASVIDHYLLLDR